ncbi:MAG TPA: zeta toxin family protein [Methylococcaceae bacterium]|nr:zeta toxin family protein [Methylococcaceae bacterium]
MNITDFHQVCGYEQLKKLRTALAVFQCTKLQSTLQQEAEGTVSHDQAKRVTYLTDLFSRIHREIFHDWKEQATVDHRPGVMTDPAKRREFRKAIEKLVLSGDINSETAVFDSNGFVVSTENIAERLAGFYYRMRNIRPFSYGNRLTLDFFMTVLSNLPAFKAVYEQGIDFRRLQLRDAVALHDYRSSREKVILTFEHALDPTRTKNLHNPPNGYGTWPENKTFLAGIPFLSHRTAEGAECLVTVNGGLIPLDRINESQFVPGRQFADFPLDLCENVVGYLPGTEALRASGKTEIDGIQVRPNGAAPLFCLDINILTGLRPPSHADLLDLLKECAGENAQLFALADNETLKRKLLAESNGDERLNRTVEIACERLGIITRKLERCKEAIFQGKTPTADPGLFVCMGGAGAGKTAVEEIAKAQCGDNFVVTSLDEFRKESDLYTVLTAANHHSDDYIFVEPFSNRLRDLVADHARENRFNILFDGTGIPYKPRYAGIVESFRSAGFHTQLTAVDAFIVKPMGRESEMSRSTVVASVKERFEKTGRALPWVITVDKHIRAPGSFLDALEHQALDKLSLFANDGEKDMHYLVAESFSCSDEEILALQEHQLSGDLRDHLLDLVRNRDDSILKKLSASDGAALDALLGKNPDFAENNVAYQIYSSAAGHRVLAIYNTRRLADFIEKRQLNPGASGEAGLLHKPAALAFHVDPQNREPWLTRLQSVSPA